MVVYIRKWKGFLAARAWLAYDIARTHVSTEVNENFKGSRTLNTWKYSVKSRKPEIKRSVGFKNDFVDVIRYTEFY